MKYSGLVSMTDAEIKQSLLDTFIDIISFIEENNLMYCLDFGTLLGAIRHKGFIPWDLDMDINMPRPDYDYFIENFVSKNKHTEIFELRTNPKFFMQFAKLSDSRTICDEHYRGFKNHPYGVSVDVYPVDGIDEKNSQKILKKVDHLGNILYGNRIKPNSKVPLKYNIGYIFSNIALAWWPYKRIVKSMSKLTFDMDYSKATKVANFEGNAKRLTFDKFIFEDYTWGEFEGIKSRIPTHYDEVLKSYYGDYMSIPPENKRVDNHTFNLYFWK